MSYENPTVEELCSNIYLKRRYRKGETLQGAVCWYEERVSGPQEAAIQLQTLIEKIASCETASEREVFIKHCGEKLGKTGFIRQEVKNHLKATKKGNQ